MKTSKISTIIAALSLVLFMSVSSIANPVTSYDGDISESGFKKQIEAVKNPISVSTPNGSSGNDFNHLRFDASKFNTETEFVELPFSSMDYLHFDVSNFSNEYSSENTELPSKNSIDYIRFDINNHHNASEISEMPVNEFDYLRFDVNKHPVENSSVINELPVK